MRFALAAVTVLAAFLAPALVFNVGAWPCVPGVAETQANIDAGLCVEVGQPLPTPTTAPPSVPELPLVPQAAEPLLGGPQPGRPLGEVCHYEPSTGQWELRRVIDGNQRILEGDEWPMKPGLCDQHHEPAPVPTSTLTIPTSTPTPEVVRLQVTPTSTPTQPIEVVGVQSTPEPVPPAVVPDVEPEPESTPEPVPAPYQLPERR